MVREMVRGIFTSVPIVRREPISFVAEAALTFMALLGVIWPVVVNKLINHMKYLSVGHFALLASFNVPDRCSRDAGPTTLSLQPCEEFLYQ